MSEALKELKRIRQETAPNTYMRDFDKNKSCDVIEQELKALNEILALHDKWLGNEMSDFEFFTLLSEIKYKYGLSKI